MTAPQQSAQSELLLRLEKLRDLNPDLSVRARERILELAEQVGPDFFPVVAEIVSELAELCRNSAVRRDGRAILQEYHDYLEQGAASLAAKGESPSATSAEAETGAFSCALVPRVQSDALEYCKVLNSASVPLDLEKAVTAFLRRNQMTGSVLEVALGVLWRINRLETIQWITSYYRRNDGVLDPENARDTLLTLLADASVNYPSELLDWMARFSGDENLLEYWPKVIRLADKVICRQGLRLWSQTIHPKNALLSQLRNYAQGNLWNDDKLLLWTRNSLAELGSSVTRFISMERGDFPEAWRGAALFLELNRIADIFLPMMLCADTLLSLPDGAEQFAMAFLGLSGKSGKDWEKALQWYAHEAVKRSFLLDAKMHRTPVKTIERLSFGDSTALRTAMSALDLGSQQFENMEQREKVIRLLAVYYASYRRSKLLMLEVGKRYHRLMRMIHEDFLAPRMEPEQFEAVQVRGILPDIATIAFEARKFLVKRQVLDNSLEELLAARITFDRFVRQKRLSLFRKLRIAAER